MQDEQYTIHATFCGNPCKDWHLQNSAGAYKDQLLAACQFAHYMGRQYDEKHGLVVQKDTLDNMVTVLEEETIVWILSHHAMIVGLITIRSTHSTEE